MDNNESSNNKLFSIGSAADYLGISIDTLRRWEKKGKVSAYRSPGGHRYFKKDDLDILFGTKYDRYAQENKSSAVSSELVEVIQETTESTVSIPSQDNTSPIPPWRAMPKIDDLNQPESTEQSYTQNNTEDIQTETNISENIQKPFTVETLMHSNTTTNIEPPEEFTPATNTQDEQSMNINTTVENIPQPLPTSENILVPQEQPEAKIDSNQPQDLPNAFFKPESFKNKNPKTSRGYKIALVAIVLFLIVDVILVLALLSTPQVISPVP